MRLFGHLGMLTVLFATWVAGGSFAYAQDEKRSISLEWEEVPDSTGYQVEVRRIQPDGTRAKPILFPTKKSVWNGKIHSGKYEMRLRSLDERGVAGDWSEPSEFWVKIPAANPLKPANKSKVLAKSAEESEVEFSWTSVKGAGGYRLEVLGPDGAVIQSEETKRTSLALQLKAAAAYRWRVISLMKEGNEPGEPPPSDAEFVLVGPKIEKPDVERPGTKFVTEIVWKAPPHAQTYSYVIARKNTAGKWMVVDQKNNVSEPKAVLDPKVAGGNFRIQVRGHGDKRLPSDFGSEEFFVFQGLRTPAAVETAMLKEAIEKDYNHLFIASYLISNLTYEGKNAEVGNRKSKYEALAGTGRLGYGYIPKGSWGALFLADMSGVVIKNKNNLFGSAELSAIWRTYILRATQLRIFGGGYLRQTPESKCTSESDCKTFNVTHAGPQAGVQIWHPFTYKFGLQFNTQAYYSAMGIQTPNARDIIPTLSYQAGMLGSYKIKENLTGFAGYAYRVDSISYKASSFEDDESSVASPNSKNDVTMTGHYLNLYLEWGF